MYNRRIFLMTIERRTSPIIVRFQINLPDFRVDPVVGLLIELGTG